MLSQKSISLSDRGRFRTGAAPGHVLLDRTDTADGFGRIQKTTVKFRSIINEEDAMKVLYSGIREVALPGFRGGGGLGVMRCAEIG